MCTYSEPGERNSVGVCINDIQVWFFGKTGFNCAISVQFARGARNCLPGCLKTLLELLEDDEWNKMITVVWIDD